MAQYLQLDGLWGGQTLPAIRRIDAGDVWDALGQGWADFMAIPTQLAFLGLVYTIIGLIAARVSYGADLLALLYPLIAGLALMGPLAAIGIYELSRRREQGFSTRFVDAFAVVRSPALISIIELGCVMLAIFVAWLYVAMTLFQTIMGGFAPTGLGDLLVQVFGTRAGWDLLILGNVAGLVFAALVLVLTVVSFPLLLDRNPGAIAAIVTSFRAVRANPGPMALWGLIVLVILFLGCVPLFVGLAIAMPVLGHATWHLYRKVVI